MVISLSRVLIQNIFCVVTYDMVIKMTNDEAITQLEKALVDLPEEERQTRLQTLRECIEFAEKNKLLMKEVNLKKIVLDYAEEMALSATVTFWILSFISTAHLALWILISLGVGWIPGVLSARYVR